MSCERPTGLTSKCWRRTSLNRALQVASIQRTLPVTVPAQRDEPFGWQDPAAWAAFGNWMYTNHLLAHPPGAGLPPFTNEFLPGQGI